MQTMNNNIILSICIPTYNGGKYIQNNIDIIIKQIKHYNLSGVEIVVSDNCSTDNIPDIMQEYQKKYPDIIKYNRNDENLGYDHNVMKCFEIAQGKFVHLFGDDDYYSPNGLKRLYEVLEKNENLSVLVLSNYYLRDDYYGLIVSRKYLNEEYTLKDKIYVNDSDNFIIDVEDRAWPNTNLVFRREYFNKIPDLNKFYKKDWIHLYILLYLAKKWPNCYLFADKYPIVIDRVGVQSWLNNNDGPRIYFNNLWTYSFANNLGYSPKVFNWYRKKLLSEYIKNITYRRSFNLITNIKYVFKYIRYWMDLPDFYFKFIPKYLKILKSMFSIENERSNNGYRVDKVFTLLGFRLKVRKKVSISKLKFKFRDGEFVFICNEKGNCKQFVKGTVFSEMYNNCKNLNESSLIYSDFLSLLKRVCHKKYVPYSTYLGICEFYQNEIKSKL